MLLNPVPISSTPAIEHIVYCVQGGTPFAGLSLGPAGLTLMGLVYGGALLYVFSKSAKFSLFKPAEEMVRVCDYAVLDCTAVA